MTTTRNTLLGRIRDSADAAAWEEFFGLYAPVLEGYARSLGLGPADAEEVRDECLAVVARRIGEFRYDRSKGTFKGWLHRIARGKVLDAMRRAGVRRAHEERPATEAWLGLADERAEPDRIWEERWRKEHLRFALDEVRRAKDDRGREILDLLLDGSLDAAGIGARAGLSANQVYKARSKLVREVRDALARIGETGEPRAPPAKDPGIAG
jgi:RNA polymerase sigma-70 factor (ECF subfamily)